MDTDTRYKMSVYDQKVAKKKKMATSQPELLFHKILYRLIEPVLHPKTRFQQIDSIPNGHEGDSKKETKSTSKLSHKRGPGIDQLLCFHQGAVGHCPQGEEEVIRVIRADVLVS